MFLQHVSQSCISFWFQANVRKHASLQNDDRIRGKGLKQRHLVFWVFFVVLFQNFLKKKRKRMTELLHSVAKSTSTEKCLTFSC